MSEYVEPELAVCGDYNLFRYCHNDPIDMTDPMGTEPPVGLTSPRQMSQWKADEEYGKAMAAAQWAGSDLMHNATGAIGIGATGYTWSAESKPQISLTMGLAGKGVSLEGTNSNLSIPDTVYDTGLAAAKAGADPAYEVAKQTKDREVTGPVGQVNGSNSGHFFPGSFERGIGVIKNGPDAGYQGSYIDRLTANLPKGSHLVRYYTVHPHYDPSRVRNVDAARFEGYWGIPARIFMRAPGYNGDWGQPRNYSFPPQW